jgi:hypothetical protein
LPLVNPAAAELCDAIDNNCTGGIDEGFDSDSDGVSACGPDGVFGNGDDDCDDSKASVSPGAVEVCDGQFNDCQASAYDSSSAPVDELDGDSDYYVACVGYDSTTWVGDALVVGGDDCADTDGSIYPGAAEVCDSIDSDCDLSLVDEFLNTDSDTLPDCVDPDDDNDGTLDVDDCAPLDPTDNTTVGNVSGSQVFSYTGGSQTLAVPECVHTMTLELWGAQGSNGNGSERGTGGQGGYATGDLSVQSGEVLTITVGGQAGYNGGGSGGFGNSNGGQGGNAGVGGGASTVHRDGSLLVVAGAGGGGGNSYYNGNHCCDGSTPEDGGAGGGLNGNDGQNDTSGNAAGVGGGGTQSSGGSGGAGINSGGSGTGGSQGSGGTGGNGFYNCAGGGGGGGYYGGGGGGAPSQGSGGSGGGGGGGSSWLGTLTSSSTSVGGNSGSGEVTISWGN